MAAKFRWYGKELEQRVARAMERRLRLAAAHVQNQVKRNLSDSTRAMGPSDVGDYPHADTGRLRNDIFVDVNAAELSAIVATSLNYGLIHEVTGRSFLRRTLNEQVGVVKKILTAPMDR